MHYDKVLYDCNTNRFEHVKEYLKSIVLHTESRHNSSNKIKYNHDVTSRVLNEEAHSDFYLTS